MLFESLIPQCRLYLPTGAKEPVFMIPSIRADLFSSLGQGRHCIDGLLHHPTVTEIIKPFRIAYLLVSIVAVLLQGVPSVVLFRMRL